MLECPFCHRAVVSMKFTRCLYCGATFPEEIVRQMRPPDLKAVERMLLLCPPEGRDAVARSYRWARGIYGAAALGLLTGAWGIVYYTLRYAPGGLLLAVVLTTALLAVAVFFLYKVIRPQPLAGRRASHSRWLD